MFVLRTTLILGFVTVALSDQPVLSGQPVEDLLAATFRMTDGDHSGSTFLVNVPNFDGNDHHQILLVTARHVFDQMQGDECELHLRVPADEVGYARQVTTLQIRDQGKRKWIQHADVDLGILPIELPEGIAAKPISFDQIGDEECLKKQLIHVGQESWIACFPAKLESNQAGWPILRKGSIASFPLLPVKTARTLLVDYTVFGGDSGAPVAVVINNRLLIIGVASSMQRQTDRTEMPFEERVIHTPLGISMVVQADYLKETIEFMRPHAQ